jgi:hypothetical protein
MFFLLFLHNIVCITVFFYIYKMLYFGADPLNLEVELSDANPNPQNICFIGLVKTEILNLEQDCGTLARILVTEDLLIPEVRIRPVFYDDLYQVV